MKACVICFMLLCLFNSSFGARKVNAGERASEVIRKRSIIDNNYRKRYKTHISINELLKLEYGETMEVTRETHSAQGDKLQRFRESFRGVPVYDTAVVVEVDAHGKLTGEASGWFFQGIADDLPDGVEPVISPEEAFMFALRREGDDNKVKHIERHDVTHYIYIDDDERAFSVYIIDYFLSKGISQPRRKHFVVDAKKKHAHVLKNWSVLESFNCGPRTYKAYGGNLKTGRIKYGNAPYCLQPRVLGDLCYLENKYVRVIDLDVPRSDSLNNTAWFKCKNGYDDEINGAFSPAIDAFYFGTAVGKMFEEWFHSTPLKKPVILKIHYGTNYENAFWDGKSCSFGDGGERYYPFTTMDMTGHEIGHGVSEQGSNLEYRGESGGVNEAFSDILGEATELYIRGKIDLKVGLDVKKETFMRDFRDPHVDGKSIEHVKEFRSSMDPHYSSGVFRRVFFVLTQQKGAHIRPVTHAFLHANRMYWRERSTFQDAGCGLIKSAYDLGQNPTAYVRALDDVGIIPCDVSRHIRRLRESNPVNGITINTHIRPLFKYESPSDVDTVTIETSSIQGNVMIIVRVGTWENDIEATSRLEIYREKMNRLVVDGVAGKILFIELSSMKDTELKNVGVCVVPGRSENKIFLQK